MKNKFSTISKSNLIVITISIAIILSLTVGYSILTKNLEIRANVTIRADKDIRITSISDYTSLNAGYELYAATYSADTFTSNIGLPNLDSKVSYNLTITNKGTKGMKITGITTSVFNNPNITYTLTGVKVGDILPSNTTLTFTITFKYNTAISVLPSETTLGSIFEFVFAEYIPSKDYVTAGNILDLRGYETPSTGVWVDSRNNKTLTLTKVIYDSINKAYDFSTSGARANLGSSIIPTTGDFTLEAFIRTPATFGSNDDQAIVAQVSDTSNDAGRFKLNLKSTTNGGEGLLVFFNSQTPSTNQSLYFSENVSTSNDYIMQLVRTNNTLKLYLDGVLESTKTYDDSNTISSGPFKLGWWNTNVQQFIGQIYAIRLYNRALEIDELGQNIEVDVEKYTNAVVEEPLKAYAVTNQLVTSGNGLYDTGNNSYRYKGLSVNNYIKFLGSDETYRIISFNSDNTIKLLNVSSNTVTAFDASGHRPYDLVTNAYCDRASSETSLGSGEYDGCNAYLEALYNNKTVSDDSSVKKVVDAWYQGLSTNIKNYIVTHTFNAGLVSDNAAYANILSQASSVSYQGNVGLLDAVDVIEASITPPTAMKTSLQLSNNYIIKISEADTGFWTSNGATSSSHDAWAVVYGTQYGKRRASRTSQVSGTVTAYFQAKPAIFIYDDVLVRGSGTIANPFIILKRSS